MGSRWMLMILIVRTNQTAARQVLYNFLFI